MSDNAQLRSCILLAPRAQGTCIRPYHKWQSEKSQVWATFHRVDDGYLVRFPKLADFVIAPDGSSAACHPCPDLSDATYEHLFFNQVLPLMRSRQGKLVFHASAVEVGSQAVAFLAASGRGKSTLAAAFSVAGAHYLTDDSLEVERAGTGYMAQPSHPSIRLWEDSGSALLCDAVMAPPVSYTSKARILTAPELNHCNEARPLAAVFILGDGASERIELSRCLGSESVAALVAHSFVLDPTDDSALSRQFDHVATLATSVPCWNLDYLRRYELLDSVRTAVTESVQSIHPGGP